MDLAGKAAGVLIFPRITKAGAGIGGEYGDGVLQVKGKTVGYYSVTSASIGLTLGVARHSDVILFMTQDALDSFTNSHGWAVGADTGAAFDQQGAGHDYTVQTLKIAATPACGGRRTPHIAAWRPGPQVGGAFA